MDWMRHIAILLISLGEEKSSNILNYMDPKQAKRILSMMYDIKDDITSEDVKSALILFQDILKNQENTNLNNKNNNIIDQEFKNILPQDAESIFLLIRDEHPQIIAVILSMLEHAKSAEIINLFTDIKRTDLLRRIASINSISKIAMDELSKLFESSLHGFKNLRVSSFHGSKLVANIIDYMDFEMEHQLLMNLKNSDPELSKRIEDHAFSFENLTKIDTDGLKKLLSAIPLNVLMFALKGVDLINRDIFLRHMPGHIASSIKSFLEKDQLIEIKKIFQSQKEIILIAHQMKINNQIFLSCHERI